MEEQPQKSPSKPQLFSALGTAGLAPKLLTTDGTDVGRDKKSRANERRWNLNAQVIISASPTAAFEKANVV
jgi:hypothetical protein